MSAVHVVPIDDLIQHDSSGGQPCVCGPTTVPVERADGSTGWEIVHHSLDGRELREAERFVPRFFDPERVRSILNHVVNWYAR